MLKLRINPIVAKDLKNIRDYIAEDNEEYAKKYKCPNPQCGKPFGNIPYRNIEYYKQCTSCGCKYTH